MQLEVEQLVAALPPVGIERATRLGLTLSPQLETDRWRQLVCQVANLARTTSGLRQTLTAWLGDALAHGGTRGRGMITECAAAAGFEAGTLRNAKLVCSRIPVSCRHDTLSWTHHCEVALAFAEANEIERWLAVAEAERLSTAELRRRIRAHLATVGRTARAEASPASVAAFRLLRELRAVGRSLVRERHIWEQWSPATARGALRELRPITTFLEVVRVRARNRPIAGPRAVAPH